jgi:hypothetical protein
VRHDHPRRTISSEPSNAHSKPALFLRAVTRVFQHEVIALPGHDGANAPGDDRRFGRAVSSRRFTRAEVVGPDAVAVIAISILAGELLRGSVDRDDQALFVQYCDMSGKRVQS